MLCIVNIQPGNLKLVKKVADLQVWMMEIFEASNKYFLILMAQIDFEGPVKI